MSYQMSPRNARERLNLSAGCNVYVAPLLQPTMPPDMTRFSRTPPDAAMRAAFRGPVYTPPRSMTSSCTSRRPHAVKEQPPAMRATERLRLLFHDAVHVAFRCVIETRYATHRLQTDARDVSAHRAATPILRPPPTEPSSSCRPRHALSLAATPCRGERRCRAPVAAGVDAPRPRRSARLRYDECAKEFCSPRLRSDAQPRRVRATPHEADDYAEATHRFAAARHERMRNAVRQIRQPRTRPKASRRRQQMRGVRKRMVRCRRMADCMLPASCRPASFFDAIREPEEKRVRQFIDAAARRASIPPRREHAFQPACRFTDAAAAMMPNNHCRFRGQATEPSRIKATRYQETSRGRGRRGQQQVQVATSPPQPRLNRRAGGGEGRFLLSFFVRDICAASPPPSLP